MFQEHPFVNKLSTHELVLHERPPPVPYEGVQCFLSSMADSIVAGLTQEQSHLSGSHNTGLPTPEQSQIHIATVRICRESFEGALLAVSPEDGYREVRDLHTHWIVVVTAHLHFSSSSLSSLKATMRKVQLSVTPSMTSTRRI